MCVCCSGEEASYLLLRVSCFDCGGGWKKRSAIVDCWGSSFWKLVFTRLEILGKRGGSFFFGEEALDRLLLWAYSVSCACGFDWFGTIVLHFY